MAKIGTNTLHGYVTREVVDAPILNQTNEIIRVAINDTDTRVDNLLGGASGAQTVKAAFDALATHKTSSDHDTHNDVLYYRKSAVDALLSAIAGPGRTVETIMSAIAGLTVHKGSADHDARYYTKSEVSALISGIALTSTIASGASFPAGGGYAVGQQFFLTTEQRVYVYNGTAWIPASNNEQESILNWMGVW